jgi:hypothetical protein
MQGAVSPLTMASYVTTGKILPFIFVIFQRQYPILVLILKIFMCSVEFLFYKCHVLQLKSKFYELLNPGS